MSRPPDRLAAALGDRYRIERVLGSGGMAVVYLAQDLKHGRPVAVKVLRPELSYELGVDRFLREIRIAATLTHPHILPLFDSGDADGYLFFVMPYIEGETLRHRLTREGRLSVGETVRLVGEIGAALGRAHEAGVVHRDVKPENILLESGHALVTDFGVARAVDAAGGDRLTRTGMAVGTPTYMSPEQVTGEGPIDARSDIYALACLSYEMLAGEPPFTGSSAPAVVAGHLAKEAPALQERGVQAPAGVERVIRRALEKDPADRFATTSEMIDALGSAVTAEAIRADELSAKRRRWGRRAAAGTALAALAAGGWWVAGELGGPTIERLAVLPASNLTRDPDQDAFVDGVHEALVSELQRAGISIVARQSVLRYRGSDLPVRRIAEELSVDGLIEPAVGREGDSVVVDVRLYDSRTELPVWSASFESRMEGVLGLYRDVSRSIADELGTVLSAGTVVRLAERPVGDPRAIEAVYNGQFHLRRFTPQDLEIARRHFQEALASDSTLAPAHLGLAMVWGYRAQSGLVPMSEARPLLDRYATRAVALDPRLARARFVEAARTVWADWDVEAGERAMLDVLALDPNDAETRVLYGHVMMILGRYDEALALGREALELDPLNPFVTGLHGVILGNAGRPEEGIELLSDLFARHPGAGFGRPVLAELLGAAGRREEAIEERKVVFGAYPGVAEALEGGWREGGYVEAMLRAGDRMAVLAEEGAMHVPAIRVANHYVGAGDEERAIDWLERAADERDPNIPYIGVAHAFWSLHDQPRFQALLRRVGVEAYRPTPPSVAAAAPPG